MTGYKSMACNHIMFNIKQLISTSAVTGVTIHFTSLMKFILDFSPTSHMPVHHLQSITIHIIYHSINLLLDANLTCFTNHSQHRPYSYFIADCHLVITSLLLSLTVCQQPACNTNEHERRNISALCYT